MALDYNEVRAKLVEALHLEKLPEDKQDQLIAQMTETLIKRVFVETMEKLGEEGVKEYEALLDRKAPVEEVEAFLSAKIPGYDVFVEQIGKNYVEEMKKHAL